MKANFEFVLITEEKVTSYERKRIRRYSTPVQKKKGKNTKEKKLKLNKEYYPK